MVQKVITPFGLSPEVVEENFKKIILKLPQKRLFKIPVQYLDISLGLLAVF